MTKHHPIILAVLLLASLGVSPARAEPAPDIIGTLSHYRTTDKDIMPDVALRFDVGFVELLAANPGVNTWRPKVGTRLVLPTEHILPEAPRHGIVVNLSDQRLYYFPGNGKVISYPIGTGQHGWRTPLGKTQIVRKRVDPTWVPPASIRAEHPNLPASIPPGPNNPLGKYALRLGWPGYEIHGTNRPYAIGRRATHGCIRLYPADIADLFHRVKVGTPVLVVNQPVKVGRRNGALYLEVHPTRQQIDEIEEKSAFSPLAHTPNVWPQIHHFAGSASPEVNRKRVVEAMAERRGVPVRITP